jgi:hypothetical protein
MNVGAWAYVAINVLFVAFMAWRVWAEYRR